MMTQKLGSELSNSCGSLVGTRRRPRSCNGSCESLPILLSHNGGSVAVDESFYLCPTGEDCLCDKLKPEHLIQHVNAVHRLPTIFFGSSSAEISLPPKVPIENASLILEVDRKSFWIKVTVNE
jgi:hypothetical protein